MPFSNLDTIRKHLSESEIAQASFRDVPVRLEGTSAVALLHRNLLADSLAVKGKELSTPHFTKQILGAEPVFLGIQQLVPESVAVATDSSLGTVFTENIDYRIDYREGNIARLDDGSIPVASEIAIWFYSYTLYQVVTDYYINNDAGTIRRSANSRIEDGQIVFLDYQTVPASLSAAQLENAITEANDRLRQWLAPEYHQSADQSLISAETYLALAILHRIRAANALQTNTASQSASVARELLALAESYERQAVRLASRFAPPRSPLVGPVGISVRGKK